MTAMIDVFVHEKAICESVQVGRGCRIWPFAHVLAGARIGEDCNICESVFVENDVLVGDRVTIKCGVQLWDGVRLGDDVFVGPNATFTNDKIPRSKKYQGSVQQTVVEDGASIGANATVLPGIRIGRHSIVGAGAVVTQDVPANALVVGNPARVVRFVSADGARIPSRRALRGDVLNVPGCLVVGLALHKNSSGTLVAIEHEADLPFVPRRTFFLKDIAPGLTRGNHAHKCCSQFLLPIAGRVSIVIDNGAVREEIILDDPAVGVYLPPMTWCSLFNFSADSLVQVFASHPYEDADYIRDYTTFLKVER